MSIERLSWQQQLSGAITDFEILCRQLALNPDDFDKRLPFLKQFPLRVPQVFVDRMEVGNVEDPLLKQVLPSLLEGQVELGYSRDPLNEADVSPVPGLLHKYHGRVLLTLTGACAIHCRYCFRRHYPYQEKVPGLSQWQPALDYIAADSSINEVILSGGDPLTLKDNTLISFLDQLECIPHLKICRFHTRLPIVIPDRITDELIARLAQSPLQIILVIHSNHANEIDEAVKNALLKCYKNHILLLNQSVLLKGINDSVDALINLSKRLLDAHVLPYYLHLLDPVSGAAHFNVDEPTAKQLMQQVTAHLPGYLVPKLVKETPGKPSKQLVDG